MIKFILSRFKLADPGSGQNPGLEPGFQGKRGITWRNYRKTGKKLDFGIGALIFRISGKEKRLGGKLGENYLVGGEIPVLFPALFIRIGGYSPCCWGRILQGGRI